MFSPEGLVFAIRWELTIFSRLAQPSCKRRSDPARLLPVQAPAPRIEALQSDSGFETDNPKAARLLSECRQSAEGARGSRPDQELGSPRAALACKDEARCEISRRSKPL